MYIDDMGDAGQSILASAGYSLAMLPFFLYLFAPQGYKGDCGQIKPLPPNFRPLCQQEVMVMVMVKGAVHRC